MPRKRVCCTVVLRENCQISWKRKDIIVYGYPVSYRSSGAIFAILYKDFVFHLVVDAVVRRVLE